LAGFEDIVVPPIELVVGEVRIALGNRDAAMAGELLGQLQVSAGTPEHGRDEIVPERVGRDRSLGSLPEGIAGALVLQVAAVYHPAMQAMFATVPLGPWDWAALLLVAPWVVVAAEVQKRLAKRFVPRTEPTEPLT